jgi:hypothetical protein
LGTGGFLLLDLFENSARKLRVLVFLGGDVRVQVAARDSASCDNTFISAMFAAKKER